MERKAVIAMSGGVDSSVAAYIIKEQGYQCMGVTMKLFHNEDIGISGQHSCCSLDDVEDARSVARALDIPYHVFNFSERFREDVIDRFVSAYENGMTPNPCIDCNRYLKFDKLYRRAEELGYENVVTGHYARIERDASTGRYLLRKALDPNKDQSYVLYSLTQEQLAHTLFPLGDKKKEDVRAIAQAQGFINAKKHDSQDICFVQQGNYADFIEQYTGKCYPEGDFVDREGTVIGRHKGIIRYTIGQRKGLGISAPEPLYVCAVDPTAQTVTLGKEQELYTRTLTAGEMNFISVPFLEGTVHLKAKVRYRQTEQPAAVTQTGADTIRLEFDEPQRAITKGQSVVLYDGDLVVGGGIIQ
ncbi:MAG: tRNA 2-thiouridine(34) synthase MnmA [Clostridium sp.]|nr:tRNA 2-thiouridine(34) synthase MnmA [Clostridium sp.]